MNPIVRHAGEGQATWFLNTLVTMKADGAETGGAYCLMEHVVTAAGNPPPHVHRDEEEAFYVLDGELEVDVDGATMTATAGTFALVPRGAVHTFRVLTDTARVLVIASSPDGATNGGAARFFDAVGTPALEHVLPVPTELDPAFVTTMAARYGIDILAPAPS
jgi:quercetin dioxygenase-like cupin family protein